MHKRMLLKKWCLTLLSSNIHTVFDLLFELSINVNSNDFFTMHLYILYVFLFSMDRVVFCGRIYREILRDLRSDKYEEEAKMKSSCNFYEQIISRVNITYWWNLPANIIPNVLQTWFAARCGWFLQPILSQKSNQNRTPENEIFVVLRNSLKNLKFYWIKFEIFFVNNKWEFYLPQARSLATSAAAGKVLTSFPVMILKILNYTL